MRLFLPPLPKNIMSSKASVSAAEIYHICFCSLNCQKPCAPPRLDWMTANKKNGATLPFLLLKRPQLRSAYLHCIAFHGVAWVSAAQNTSLCKQSAQCTKSSLLWFEPSTPFQQLQRPFGLASTSSKISWPCSSPYSENNWNRQWLTAIQLYVPIIPTNSRCFIPGRAKNTNFSCQAHVPAS
jgi:hypothetical protein